MVEGVVAGWFKKVGDKVASGEILAEIETDKATMEFESFYDGVLLYIGVEKGKAVPVNTLLAIIGEEGEDISAIINAAPVVASAEVKAEEKVEIPTLTKVVSAPKTEVKTAPVVSTPVYSANNDGRIFISPLAKKLASERGIDINQVAGTGEGGRIVKRDIDHFTPYTPANRGGFSHVAPGVE
jgi:pyruvate dehydrogenase E2 component (dihydrolipoamide acetyltransferase)